MRRGQEVFRIGGWGYLLDSAGSGYDIGRQALEAALRAQDGRGCPTALSAKLADALGAPVQDSLTRLYAEGKNADRLVVPCGICGGTGRRCGRTRHTGSERGGAR